MCGGLVLFHPCCYGFPKQLRMSDMRTFRGNDNYQFSGENMPQRRTAIKDLRKTHTRHLHNLQIKTDLKKTVKNFLAATTNDSTRQEGTAKKEDAQELLKKIYKKFDKAANRHVLHKKTAARRKSRFARTLGTLATSK